MGTSRVARVANVILGAAPEADLAPDALVARARRRTGLHDFGDESFRGPLGVLVDAIEREARLHPLGRRITRTRLVGILENRLRVQSTLAKAPEIADEPTAAPVVIAGIQRTGTTLLHRLLAAHPGLRALASWEALHPAPAVPSAAKDRQRRIRQAELAELGLKLLAPEFFAIHPVQARAPEEDVLLLDFSFLSTVPEATLRVPSFSRWLEQQDTTPAYRYMKLLLQLLQWQDRTAGSAARGGASGVSQAKPWVLKTPHHLEWLDTLFTVFPDARVIQTHRDPTVTLASFCSMIAHGRAVFSDAVDLREIGRDWSRKVRRMVDRAIDTRARLGPERFLDVHYRDLLADPIAQVRRIARFAGLALPPAAETRVQWALAHNPQHKHGRHVYRLEDYGLSRHEVDRLFADYRERFSIPAETR